MIGIGFSCRRYVKDPALPDTPRVPRCRRRALRRRWCAADARPHAEQYPELHPQLKAQLRELRLRTGSAVPDVPMLLRLINEHYQTVERRAPRHRRSPCASWPMRPRRLAHEAREQSSEHLQVILDHIKDVVLTVDEDGMIRTFNPTGERVFGYAQAEVVGQRIDLLMPKIAAAREHPAGAGSAWRRAAGDTALDLASRGAVGAAQGRRAVPGRVRRQQGAAAGARDVRAVPARCHRAARVRAGDARERGALSAAGGPRPRCHRRARCGRRPLRRCQRQRASSSLASTANSCCKSGRSTLSPPLQPDGGASARAMRVPTSSARSPADRSMFEWLHRDALRQARSSARCAWCACRAARAAWCAAASPTSPSASAPSAWPPPSAQVFEQLTRNAPLPEVLDSITAPHRVGESRHRCAR